MSLSEVTRTKKQWASHLAHFKAMTNEKCEMIYGK